MDKNLVADILELLVPQSERNKKQVALFLTQPMIDELDETVKFLSNYSNGRINRNSLIELGIKHVLRSIPQVIEEYQKNNFEENESEYDLLLCPAQASGIEFLLKNHYWEYVRINIERLKNLKYMALYVGAPYSCIMYIAKIKGFREFIIDKQKKYRIFLEDIKELDTYIPLNDVNPIQTRSIKYTTLKKLLNAKEYKDIL